MQPPRLLCPTSVLQKRRRVGLSRSQATATTPRAPRSRTRNAKAARSAQKQAARASTQRQAVATPYVSCGATCLACLLVNENPVPLVSLCRRQSRRLREKANAASRPASIGSAPTSGRGASTPVDVSDSSSGAEDSDDDLLASVQHTPPAEREAEPTAVPSPTRRQANDDMGESKDIAPPTPRDVPCTDADEDPSKGEENAAAGSVSKTHGGRRGNAFPDSTLRAILVYRDRYHDMFTNAGAGNKFTKVCGCGCVCACAHVCVCACVRARVCVRACVCVLFLSMRTRPTPCCWRASERHLGADV